MKKLFRLFSLPAIILASLGTFGQTTTRFNDGYLTVFKATSSSALTNTGTAIIVEEYNRTTLSQSAPNFSVALPTSTGNKLVVSGTATSSGGLTRSENGRYLIIPGYDGLVGDANSTFTTNATLRTISGTGTVNTGISGGGSTLWLTGNNNLRGGTSDDGTNYWFSGNGVGLQTSTNGSTVTTVSTTSTNNRNVFIYNGQLYLTTGAGTKGIYSVGTGKPTATGQTASLLFTPTNTDPYAFSLSPDGTTLYYVASTTGGIYRSTYNGSLWTAGTQIFSANGYTGLAVDWNNYTFNTSAPNGALIYACNPSTIIAAADNGTSLLTTTALRTEPTPANNAFRQLAFSPIKQNVSLGLNTPLTGTISPASTNVVLFQFNLNADEGNSTLKKIILTQLGTSTIGNGNDISNFRLIEDSNGNGIAESGELSASLATGATSGSDITFSSIVLANYINEGAGKNFIVVGDVSASATNGTTFVPSIVSNKTLNGINYTTNIINAGGSWINIGINGSTGNALSISTPTPTITVNTGSFNGTFGNIVVGLSSVSSPFIVSGSNLTANLIITPPVGFEIRTGSNPFSTNVITLIPSAGSVSNTTIDVRFTPLAATVYNGNITCSSAGATTQNVAVNGTGIAPAQATKLVITNITPASPFQNTAFSVTVQAQDGSNVAQNVTSNTNVSISLTAGNGSLTGTLTGTITAGSNSVTISGVLYDTAQTGVILTASRTSGDVLTSGNSSPFTVLGIATHLVFSGVPATGVIATNLSSFTVEARKDDNTVDANFTGTITVSKASGPGTLSGTTAVAAVAGVATFSTLQFNMTGTVTLLATATGLSGSTSSNIVINATLTPSLSEVILPQYMEGNSSSNTTRLPYTYRVTLSNLSPNSTYRYYNQVVLSSDLPTATGSGNCIFAIQNGFIRSTSPGFSTIGAYSSFTTDANGSYTGWFITEPTGNARFLSGNNVFMRIMLNDGLGGTSIATRLTTADSVHVLNLTPNTGSGTGLIGNSSALPKNFVFTFDNLTGTGRPVSGTYVESDSVSNTIANSYAAFYANNVEGVAGAYGTIIPNTNTNGIQRIEQRDFITGTVIGCPSIDTDGIWPSGANTVNPTGGISAITFTPSDALLDASVNSTVGGIVSSSTTACAGTNNGTLALSGNIGSVVKWQYSNDNFSTDIHDTINTTLSQSFLNLIQTTYYRAIVQNGGCAASNSAPAAITITPLPAVSFAPLTSPVCSDAFAFTLTGGSPLGGVYSGPGVSSGMFDPAVAGTGTTSIIYTVTANSCSNSDSENIVVSICTGLKDEETAYINIYPNPSTGAFKIDFKNSNFSEMVISIMNVRGQEIYSDIEKNVTGNYSKQINIEKQPKGLYFITMIYTDVKSGQQEMKIEKLVIN